MTPIRNVTDREFQLQAEIEALNWLVEKLKPDALLYRWLRDMAEAADWEMLGYLDPGQISGAIEELIKEGAQ